MFCRRAIAAGKLYCPVLVAPTPCRLRLGQLQDAMGRSCPIEPGAGPDRAGQPVGFTAASRCNAVDARQGSPLHEGRVGESGSAPPSQARMSSCADDATGDMMRCPVKPAVEVHRSALPLIPPSSWRRSECHRRLVASMSSTWLIASVSDTVGVSGGPVGRGVAEHGGVLKLKRMVGVGREDPSPSSARLRMVAPPP